MGSSLGTALDMLAREETRIVEVAPLAMGDSVAVAWVGGEGGVTEPGLEGHPGISDTPHRAIQSAQNTKLNKENKAKEKVLSYKTSFIIPDRGCCMRVLPY
jgi:hypothetical protein